jgi:hypothetical protein
MTNLSTFALRNISGMPVGIEMDFERALRTPHKDDRCFVSYPGNVRLRVSEAEGVLCHYGAIDYDLDGPGAKEHKEALRASRQILWSSPIEVPQLNHIVPGWRACYLTAYGFRVIYEFSRPLAPHEQAGLMAGMRRHILELPGGILNWDGGADLRPDEACADWTRLQRLPMVVRPEEFPGNLSQFESISQSIFSQEVLLDVDAPGFDWQQAATYDNPAGRPTPLAELPNTDPVTADQIRSLVKEMHGWESLTEAISEQLPVTPGSRDDSAARGTGAVARAGRRAGLTLEQTWACIEKPFLDGEAMIPRGPGIALKAWSALSNFWEADAQRVVEANLDIEAALAKPDDSSLIDRWRSLNKVPEHWGQEEFAEAQVIFSSGKNRWVLTDDGSYRWLEALEDTALGSEIRRLTGGRVKTETVDDASGEKVLIKGSRIGGTSPLIAAKSGACSGAIYDGRSGEGLDFTRPYGITPFNRLPGIREDAVAYQHPWIQAFLKEAFRESAARVTLWLSYFTAIDEYALPLLMISGKLKTGKTEFCLALNSMFDKGPRGHQLTNWYAGAKSLDSPFNSYLMESPFLCSDDAGKDSSRNKYMAMALLIRQNVTTKVKDCVKKGKDGVPVEAFHRYALTTNDIAMYSSLTDNPTVGDRVASDAVRSRILSVQMYREGVEKARSEIGGDDPAETFRELMVQHVLWLNTPEGRQFAADMNPDVEQNRGYRIDIPTVRLIEEAAQIREMTAGGAELLAQAINWISNAIEEGNPLPECFVDPGVKANQPLGCHTFFPCTNHFSVISDLKSPRGIVCTRKHLNIVSAAAGTSTAEVTEFLANFGYQAETDGGKVRPVFRSKDGKEHTPERKACWFLHLGKMVDAAEMLDINYLAQARIRNYVKNG